MTFLVQFGINKDYGLVQFCQSLKKFTRAYLFQIALEIKWLPVQINTSKFSKDHKVHEPAGWVHFVVNLFQIALEIMSWPIYTKFTIVRMRTRRRSRLQ